MINAINTIQSAQYMNRSHSIRRTVGHRANSAGKRALIRHFPPAKSRHEILAKLKEKGLKTSPQEVLEEPSESPLMDSEKSEQTKEKLKTLLTKGGFNFSTKERDVLAKIVK